MASGARRCLILANPRAGALSRHTTLARLRARWRRALIGGKPAAEEDKVPPALELLVEAAGRAGVLCEIEIAPAPGQLPERLRAAVKEGFDAAVAVGGDGTARALAQALLQTQLTDSLALGILPLGTANNIARSLNIPFGLDAAMRILAEGTVCAIDAGQIGGEYFLEGAGVGLFADAVQGFGAQEARVWEVGRLLRILAPLLWNPRIRTVLLTLDGIEEREAALLVIAANGPYIGEAVPLAPTALLTDGLFDVVIVGALSRRELLGFARAVRRGTHLALPCVRRAQAREVGLRRAHRGPRPLPVHADDHIAAYTPTSLRVLPGALRVLVPSGEANAPCDAI